MEYITKTDEYQEEIECEDYDYFNDGYTRYEEYDEFAGWRDLVI